MKSRKEIVRRPGGRTDQTRQSVAQAVVSLIESGNASFELQDVSRLSGVHRTTIYRRWRTREDLLTEALTLNVSKLRIPEADDWQVYLRKLAHELSRFLSTPMMMAVGSLMASPNTPREFREHFYTQFGTVIEKLTEPLDKAKKQGKFRADADTAVIINVLLSYILSFILLLKAPPSDAVIDKAVRNLKLIGKLPSA
jgi:AcrR family transcriptional regulator